MARGPRAASEYGLYHVIQRGNNRKWLFMDDEDFLQMLNLRKKKVPVPGVPGSKDRS